MGWILSPRIERSKESSLRKPSLAQFALLRTLAAEPTKVFTKVQSVPNNPVSNRHVAAWRRHENRPDQHKIDAAIDDGDGVERAEPVRLLGWL